MRDQEIRIIEEKINNVEDDVFVNFCSQIRVSNIRLYEERELVLVSSHCLTVIIWQRSKN